MRNWFTITSRKGKPSHYSNCTTRSKWSQRWKVSSFSFAICRTKKREVNKSMETTPKYSLPNNMVTKLAYSASKLRNKFNIKSKIKQDYQHQRWRNFFLGARLFRRAIVLACPIGPVKNGCSKPKCTVDQDTTRNIVRCFLLPK